jgi:transmembrane sensor
MKPAGEQDHGRRSIAEVAAQWVARRDRGLTAAEAQAFERWKAADPRHAGELRKAEQTWRGLDGLEQVSELAAMAEDVVVRARARKKQAQRSRLARFGAAAAAAVMLTVAGWSWLGQTRGPESVRGATENYRVLPSTLQRIPLPDGSFAELNGASRIQIDYTTTERRVTLLEGEVHFVVEPNPTRPFFVTAGQVTVRAVGTAFNVRLATESIEVLVTEGKVRLEHEQSRTLQAGEAPAVITQPVSPAPDLVMGQRAVIPRGPTEAQVQIGDVGKAEIEAALGWQSTRLVFNNTPLDEVVAGFNRYHAHRLVIGDPKLRQRTLTGVVRADNLDGFVRLLSAAIDVKGEPRDANETVLLPLR